MDHVREALTKKIGPFPGYVYVGGVVGALLLWHLRHKGSVSSSPASQTDPGLGALNTSGGLLGGGGGGGGGGDAGGVLGAAGGVAGAGTFTDPSPVFVPIPDPVATQFPTADAAPPADVIQPIAPAPANVPDVIDRTLANGQNVFTSSAPKTVAPDALGRVLAGGNDVFTSSSPQDSTRVMAAAIAAPSSSDAAQTVELTPRPTVGHNVAV